MILNAIQARNTDGMMKKFHCTYCSAIVTIMEEDIEFKDRSRKSETQTWIKLYMVILSFLKK